MSEYKLSETTQMLLRDAECRVNDSLKALRKAEFEADWSVTNAKRDYLDAQRNLARYEQERSLREAERIRKHNEAVMNAMRSDD